MARQAGGEPRQGIRFDLDLVRGEQALDQRFQILLAVGKKLEAGGILRGFERFSQFRRGFQRL